MSKKTVDLRNRNGQALIEFAFISVVMTLFVMGLLGLGMMLIHSTATAATSINASMLFDLEVEKACVDQTNNDDEAIKDIYEQLRQKNLFKEEDLVLTPAEFSDALNGGESVAKLNRKMLSQYFYDIDRQVYRYPGTVVETQIDSQTEDTILIPIFEQATQSITGWRHPVKIDYELNSNSVDVWISMASQPSTLLVYYVDDQADTVGGPQEAGIGTVASLPTGYSLSTTSFIPDPRFSTRVSDANRGTYGLGELELGAIGSVIPRRVVRPFRRVIEFHGTFRLIPKPEEEPTP